MLLVVMPDGTSLPGPQIVSWVNCQGTLQVSMTGVVVSSGFHYQQMYVYTPANSGLADLMVFLLNYWFVNNLEGQKNMTAEMANYLTIATISPNSGSAGTPATITLTGTGYLGGETVTVGGNVYPTTFISATSISFAYDGTLSAATYDILLTPLNGPTFKDPQCLTLS